MRLPLGAIENEIIEQDLADTSVVRRNEGLRCLPSMLNYEYRYQWDSLDDTMDT